MYAVYISKLEILFNHHVTEQVERATLQSCVKKITRFTNVLYLRRIVAL